MQRAPGLEKGFEVADLRIRQTQPKTRGHCTETSETLESLLKKRSEEQLQDLQKSPVGSGGTLDRLPSQCAKLPAAGRNSWPAKGGAPPSTSLAHASGPEERVLRADGRACKLSP